MNHSSMNGEKHGFFSRNRVSLILTCIALAFYAAVIVNHLHS